ncbi:MAG TPA: ParB/RepB/Spo0J family partition protein [Anaerolineae bacterium]|nr:ParB/RepB/Spo0J family partition protein [Anaerolineae bacterium]
MSSIGTPPRAIGGGRHGLGKGLGALIPGADRTAGILQVPVTDITTNPRQPRHEVPAESVQELAESIREHGLLQPLIVTRREPSSEAGGPRYQLIAGERRWRAAALAGLEVVPVLVKEATPQQTLELALVENIQRADLNPLEEAGAYHQLMDEFGLTQEQVAQRVGKSRVAVANALRLLRLADEIKEALLACRITEGHARALLALTNAHLQLRVLRTIEKDGLTVRQAEELVRRLTAEEEQKPRQAVAQSPETRALEDRFRSALGTKVNLFRSKRGGKLVIHFFSEEELQSIFDRIVGENL